MDHTYDKIRHSDYQLAFTIAPGDYLTNNSKSKFFLNWIEDAVFSSSPQPLVTIRHFVSDIAVVGQYRLFGTLLILLPSASPFRRRNSSFLLISLQYRVTKCPGRYSVGSNTFSAGVLLHKCKMHRALSISPR